MKLVARLAILLTVPVALLAQAPAGFPHDKHAKLFPTCAGCHAGVAAGDAARTFPAPAVCATCHNGTIRSRVTWQPRVSRGAGLLAFSHPAHAAKVRDATCESCHAPAGSPWMNVSAATPERCLSCHAHSATGHLADDNTCATCHRPLTAATALTDARIVALPRPPSHALPRFTSTHGSLANAPSANCATCHARESCTRCHVDASRQGAIRALGSDARIARTVAGKAPSYPVPASHGDADFALTHGDAARASSANCSTCHARASCETCHIGDGAQKDLLRIPGAAEASAPGVQLHRAPLTNPPGAVTVVSAAQWMPQPHQADTTHRQVRVHAPDFARMHGPIASSGELQCEGCHARKFCTDCHAGERVTRHYHPTNFVSIHAPQAYSRETDCATCHNTAVFCRDCHTQVGLAPKGIGTRSPVFHNAAPLWLLQHGRAARQDLPTCTTCHQQTYCMQCHSDLGSRINPHGPGFNASKMASRNSQICLACHFKNPLSP